MSVNAVRTVAVAVLSAASFCGILALTAGGAAAAAPGVQHSVPQAAAPASAAAPQPQDTTDGNGTGWD
jgi:hypothetical protein